MPLSSLVNQQTLEEILQFLISICRRRLRPTRRPRRRLARNRRSLLCE